MLLPHYNEPTERLSVWRRMAGALRKYMRFIGPGLMVSVAYMDPGNYSTAVAAGLAYQYKLLFSILLLNCLAIFLQILSAKLGAVTGLDLAANCRAHLPPRWNVFIYVLAEVAIVATDLAEVVGTAIALNILFNIPLVLGVIITVVDVLIVLMAYRPNGPLLFIRVFELFVSVLVAGTVTCFAIELFQVAKEPDFSAAAVLRGFLPSKEVIDTSEREGGNGLFLSLAILGATVMPHLLYLGLGLVQARLKDYDIKHGHYTEPDADAYRPVKSHTPRDSLESSAISPLGSNHENSSLCVTLGPQNGDHDDQDVIYRPSIHAIRDTMTYTIVELVVSLFTVALFVNATILIVAGATMGGVETRDDDSDSDSDSDSEPGSAAGDLFTIYNLLSTHISPTAGLVFALALLCLGQSAGVVCTLAGQMVLEGFLRWSFSPVIRRLVTRAIAIAPCLFVVMYSGREGLARTLNASQVVLLILLPVVTAPLIWFTCSKTIMRVPIHADEGATIFEGPSQEPFCSTEPAILLQDLRKAHPCLGWEETEDGQLRPELAADYTDREPLYALALRDTEHEASLDNSLGRLHDTGEIYLQGHSDMSNGPVMKFLAVSVWGFVTCLNLFLLGSMMLGYDVPL